MASLSRQVVRSARCATSSRPFLRPLATIDRVIPPTAATPPGAPIRAEDKQPVPNNDPLPVPPTVFPAPADPWDVAPGTQKRHVSPRHSPLRIKLAEFGARVLGYNSRASTAIRETGSMMSGIVEAVDRDHVFWYEGQCRFL